MKQRYSDYESILYLRNADHAILFCSSLAPVFIDHI